MQTTERALIELAETAATIATTAARLYLEKHSLKADPIALEACLKSWLRFATPEAIKDASNALAVGMNEHAAMTFKASIVLAGIEAARDASKS